MDLPVQPMSDPALQPRCPWRGSRGPGVAQEQPGLVGAKGSCVIRARVYCPWFICGISRGSGVLYIFFSLQEIHSEAAESHCCGIEVCFTLGWLLACSFGTSEKFPSDTTSALLREALIMLSIPLSCLL